MRVFGATLPFDGAGGGGQGTVTSVAGVFPVFGGNVPLTAADVPSTGPSTTQADFDAIFASTTLSIKTIESWADFTLYAVESPAGVWTFDQALEGAGSMTVPTGARIVGGPNHLLASKLPAGFTILADVDAAVMSGPLIMSNVTIVQASTGANAACVDIISAGRASFVADTQLQGGRVGMRWTTVPGVAKATNVISTEADVGFEVSGSVNTVIASGTFSTSSVADHVGYSIDASSVVSGGVEVADPSFSLVDGQHGFAIADAATFTSPALMQISGAANSGPQDAMLRQLVAGIVASSVNSGGTYTGADGDYPATQASTSGSGTGAEFTVTLTSGTITAVVSIDEPGTGYAALDTITLTVVGPTQTVAAVLDVDAVATDMDSNDDRLVVKGGPSVADWSAQAVASRFDTADPLIVDTSGAGAGVFAIVPYEDGAGNLEIVASISSHFTLFKNGADPLDWYIEYTGPLTNSTIRLGSDLLGRRGSAGPSNAILAWQRAPSDGMGGHGAFALLPDTEAQWSNTNSYTPRTGRATFQGVNTFDRFRPVVSDSAAIDVELGELRLDVSI